MSSPMKSSDSELDSDEWCELMDIIRDVAGITMSRARFRAGEIGRGYCGTAPIEHIDYVSDLPGTDSPAKSGRWVRENELEQKSELEMQLIRALGIWRPRAWEYTAFVFDDARVSRRSVQGSHDAIPYPSFTATYDRAEVLRLARALNAERKGAS